MPLQGYSLQPSPSRSFAQIQQPNLPYFSTTCDEDEDPVPCFAMTNPYEAILTHDPARTCVCVTPDMLHSFQPLTYPPSESDQGINVWYPQGSGKTHVHQMGLWSIMSDRPSYTIHPQPLEYLVVVVWISVSIDYIIKPLRISGSSINF